jgi:rhodanese-related sulfurtransferase
MRSIFLLFFLLNSSFLFSQKIYGVIKDENSQPHSIFTGDTLFVGDVGRPDLFSGNLSKEELAAMMYDTLQQKIKPLNDNIIVYPAHGPGSACGKALGKETFSTIGTQKATNYALGEMSREDFIKELTSGLTPPPAYFPINARLNREGYPLMDEVLPSAMRPLSIEGLKEMMGQGAWVVDTRPAASFTQGFVPGAIFLGLEGRMAEWAGAILPFEQPIILVAEPGKERESITRLARVGLDKIEGYLEGGMETWTGAGELTDLIIDIDADELAMDLPHDEKLEVLDVRKPSEFDAGHVAGASNMPLDTMADVAVIAGLDEGANLYVHCAGGYRSVIASSLLKRQGYHNLRNVLGGWGAIKLIPEIPVEQAQMEAK